MSNHNERVVQIRESLNVVETSSGFEATRRRNLAEIALSKVHATFKHGKLAKVRHQSQLVEVSFTCVTMQMKRKWLREFLYQSETREDFYKRIEAATPQDREEAAGPTEVVIERKKAALPEYYEFRHSQYEERTRQQVSVMNRAVDLDGFLMESNIESCLQRQRMMEEGVFRDHITEESPSHDFLMSAFSKEVEAATKIQRAFRRFKAACDRIGWPSSTRSPAKTKVDMKKVSARYMEIRHQMVTEENMKKWDALKDVHGLVNKFEEGAKARSLKGELRTPLSGKSEKYRLQDPSYRRELLGEEFVKLEEMLRAAGAPAAEATAASIAAVARAAMKMRPKHQDDEDVEEEEKEDAVMDLRHEKDPMKRAQM